ncbi:hypothetical protein PR048_015213 [Dryococelus australis]|uniref:Uncharacterized protein n=1 Tax=Dryococelus australis TaxID=614101 RepID=A0ABQ9HGG8_9NEOP|nr:hypothetical protein PR048_015213 [Dryococelus australis]
MSKHLKPTSRGAIGWFATDLWVREAMGSNPGTNLVQSPAGSPDFRKWESSRTMPLVGGFSRGSPVSPLPFIQGATPYPPQSPSSTLKTSPLRVAQISVCVLLLVCPEPGEYILLETVGKEGSPRQNARGSPAKALLPGYSSASRKLSLTKPGELHQRDNAPHSIASHRVACSRVDFAGAPRHVCWKYAMVMDRTAEGRRADIMERKRRLGKWEVKEELRNLFLELSQYLDFSPTSKTCCAGTCHTVGAQWNTWMWISDQRCSCNYWPSSYTVKQIFTDILRKVALNMMVVPTKASQIRFPTKSFSHFHTCESCRTMPLVGGFLGDLPFPAYLNSGAAPCSPPFTLIGPAAPDDIMNRYERYARSKTELTVICVGKLQEGFLDSPIRVQRSINLRKMRSMTSRGVEIQQRRNLRIGKTGVPRKNTLANVNVCQIRVFMWTPQGIESDSPWWEASSLTTVPPRPYLYISDTSPCKGLSGYYWKEFGHGNGSCGNSEGSGNCILNKAGPAARDLFTARTARLAVRVRCRHRAAVETSQSVVVNTIELTRVMHPRLIAPRSTFATPGLTADQPVGNRRLSLTALAAQSTLHALTHVCIDVIQSHWLPLCNGIDELVTHEGMVVDMLTGDIGCLPGRCACETQMGISKVVGWYTYFRMGRTCENGHVQQCGKEDCSKNFPFLLNDGSFLLEVLIVPLAKCSCCIMHC